MFTSGDIVGDHLAAYNALMSKAADAYSILSFSQAMKTFPREPVIFALMSLGAFFGKFVGLIGTALAESSTFTPPLGLSQPVFSGIVILFAVLFAILVLGLFWAGYFAKP